MFGTRQEHGQNSITAFGLDPIWVNLDRQCHCPVESAPKPLATMQAIEPRITADVTSVLSVKSSVASRTSFGGTAPKNVRVQAESWRKRLQNDAISG